MPTALVTGANSGIGNAFAQVLLKEGYKVFAVDRHVGEGLKNLREASVGELDVTSPDAIKQFRDKFIQDDPIDLLLNIAGVAMPKEKDSLESTTIDTFEKVFAVNTYGPMFVVQALLPNLMKSPNAKIGTVTSRVGSIGDNTSGGMYAYRSSKAAANSIGRSMAMDLKEKNIPVLLLHPGFVRSGLLPGADGPEFVEPEEAASKLWNNVVKVKGMNDTGTFWHREGHELPW
ncbi:hypothetical protein PMZ80_002813 [Knufia obscura]|uniref:Uncharacterized protein n=2 Tax=Knufia TaxID=430999 RepID=A0AAN8E7Z6_9EURO|nr:hypothetical protein PMZ80_002813 [Knufia obscura]KAK5948404.1 hypothetical protein OHC33_010578 [Knufia fluminis]